MGVPLAVLAVLLARGEGWLLETLIVLLAAVAWGIVVSLVMEGIVRPMQTLGNVLAALREDDYSFRARGGRRDDALGDLALEVNALAGMLQGQRGSALEAVALAERVMLAMQTPVLAFDSGGRVRMLNPAAERTFNLRIGQTLGRSGSDLGLEGLLRPPNEESISLGEGTARWVVKRANFRMRGVPHVLVVLSEVSGALREEERNAWRRLVRVMGHEINNSLAPIKSIAGSLRTRLPAMAGAPGVEDLDRGLGVIENRAESLNRFLQAYRQLSGLPKPRLAVVSAGALCERVAQLAGAVTLERGGEIEMQADGDQIQQAMINLVKNAVEAASGPDAAGAAPEIKMGWAAEAGVVVLYVLDNGPGVVNPQNLFVPFYTTKPEGTGIGLALALQIAEGHGGTVTLRNRDEGQGCRAELRLPVEARAYA